MRTVGLALVALMGMSTSLLADDEPPLGVNWDAIGLVETETNACTGTLIANRIAVTAAHCLFDDEFRREDPLFFYAGLGPDGYAAASAIERAVIPRQFDPEVFAYSIDVDQYDYALLVLEDPIGRTTGRIGIRAVEDVSLDSYLIEAGYGETDALIESGVLSLEAPERLVATLGCSILYVYEDRTFENNCLVVPGNSGGPLLAVRGFSVHLVGISSYATGIIEYAVSASAFSDSFEDLKRELAGEGVS